MNKNFETDGMGNGRPIYCLTFSYECLHCDKNYICYSSEPLEEYDDFGSGFDSWEDWEEM